MVLQIITIITHGVECITSSKCMCIPYMCEYVWHPKDASSHTELGVSFSQLPKQKERMCMHHAVPGDQRTSNIKSWIVDSYPGRLRATLKNPIRATLQECELWP